MQVQRYQNTNTKISKYKYARGPNQVVGCVTSFGLLLKTCITRMFEPSIKTFFLTIETFVCYTDDRSETSLTCLFPCKPKDYPYV